MGILRFLRRPLVRAAGERIADRVRERRGQSPSPSPLSPTLPPQAERDGFAALITALIRWLASLLKRR